MATLHMVKSQLLPISSKDNVALTKFRISIANVLLVFYLIPPLSVCYFIINTLITDFEGSTATHCRVFNVLPSMSSVAKSQQVVWKLVTWQHFPARLLLIWLYSRYYCNRLNRGARKLSYVALYLLLQESISTVALAQWAHINGSVRIHIITVLSMWLSGCGYLAISFICYKQQRYEPLKPHEQLSYRLKRNLLCVYFCTIVSMWSWYLLHTQLCLPLVYSVFALCEYIVTLTNMLYLCTCYLDFYTLYLCHGQYGYILTEF
ncbi:post-GPI attachment to proteins factor 2 [Drosophila busckii]|uniref:post-GPI attachment to proteins factor 2 n=1 Tax=Drosophila busckii TaxID=30019 RepID=UPI001433285A|nr:post-GPI attachment to proteins factor 2 [Drosophila busckii]